MRWRAGAPGSSWLLPAPARWALLMVFCKAPGPLEWSRRSGRSWRRGVGISRGSETIVSEFIQAVERRHFVSFLQRRIVEYRIAKIFDGRSHGQYCLPDVHDLR